MCQRISIIYYFNRAGISIGSKDDQKDTDEKQLNDDVWRKYLLPKVL